MFNFSRFIEITAHLSTDDVARIEKINKAQRRHVYGEITFKEFMDIIKPV